MKTAIALWLMLLPSIAGCGRTAIQDPMVPHALAEPATVTIWVRIDGTRKQRQSVRIPAGTMIISRELWHIATQGDD